MPDITPPAASNPIVDKDGVMSPEFQRWVTRITGLDILVGTGSPEGSIEATVGTSYMDSAGSTGSLLYLKRDADIAGDRTKGWIAV